MSNKVPFIEVTKEEKSLLKNVCSTTSSARILYKPLLTTRFDNFRSADICDSLIFTACLIKGAYHSSKSIAMGHT